MTDPEQGKPGNSKLDAGGPETIMQELFAWLTPGSYGQGICRR